MEDKKDNEEEKENIKTKEEETTISCSNCSKTIYQNEICSCQNKLEYTYPKKTK